MSEAARFGRLPTADDLRALARKYRTLAALRRDFESTGNAGETSALRALAREFPGVLRELDTMPLAQIEQRARELDDAASAIAAPALWMAWMVAYHAAMRAALLVKASISAARGGPRRRAVPFDPSAAGGIALLVSQTSGEQVDDAFVCAVARPPFGRLNRVVFERLGLEFGVPPDEIWEALFPARRPGRY